MKFRFFSSDLPQADDNFTETENLPGDDVNLNSLDAMRDFANQNPDDPFAVTFHNSLDRIEGYREGAGISVESLEEGLNLLIRICNDLSEGIIETDTIECLIKGMECDRRVELARAEGEIEGRNARIIEMGTPEDLSDGVPALGGTSAGRASTAPKSIFDLAGFAR